MVKKRRFLVGGVIVALAIGYLGFRGYQDSATFYYGVGELIEQRDSIRGENIRVGGQVVPGSVEQEPLARSLKFTIAAGERSLPVVYQGVVPDAFKAGNEVVVEGRLTSTGVFQAKSILTKCPSKYVPAK